MESYGDLGTQKNKRGNDDKESVYQEWERKKRKMENESELEE